MNPTDGPDTPLYPPLETLEETLQVIRTYRRLVDMVHRDGGNFRKRFGDEVAAEVAMSLLANDIAYITSSTKTIEEAAANLRERFAPYRV